MSQLAITELSFFEVVLPEKSDIKGGFLVPTVTVAYSTDYDTRAIAAQNIEGDLIQGFKLDLFSLGSGAGAAAAAASVGGTSTAVSYAKA
ncbi:MAG: hypothetical protein JO235_21575 [Chroococcidiopsidaceae cyanobacterium CP_BM_RX_35]|nr:hypothetical protein [Chroococcidiopsidaceae cyanobacterium CP_BM_RX_35]